MKRIVITILLLSGIANAYSQKKQISGTEAMLAARNWISKKYKDKVVEIYGVDSVKGTHGYVMYEVYTSLNQTVLLSGSRSCLPILGTYNGSCISEHDIPCGLEFMLEYYRRQIDSSFTDNLRRGFFEGEWNSLLAGDISSDTKGPIIAPLTVSRWGQRSKYPGRNDYNFLIHGDENCEHFIAGCVAVAMGQLAYFWRYPVLMKSRIEQYDWCNMVDELDNPTSSSFENNRYAISYLLKECGKYVDMDYGCESSGASTCDAASVFREKFGFHEHTDCFHRYAHDNFIVNDWEEMIVYNLRAGRPVIYAGVDDDNDGHAFICDGYDGSGLFHFNWGWYGYFSGPNDYFTLRNPNPGASSNYHNRQRAILYARPKGNQDICEMNLVLNEFYSNNILTSLGPHLIVPQTMTTLTSASASSPAAWRTIPAGALAEYVAHEEVILEDGFEAEWGSEFEAWIEPCAKCGESRGDGSATRTLTQREDSLASDSTEATYMAPGHSEFTIHNSEFKIGLFPNPTDGPLTMETDGEAEAVVVYDAKGLPVGGWRLVGRSGRSLQLDVAALRPGAYILAVRTAAGTSTARFVRR